ncbi:hypothetical protein [Bifidobacterium sp. SO1]|uniref:hypothetical protein n=1 Tax=Bifidobacterium sp. SO1 TaxID=2809029 RepID=UPI001BDD8C11|nr:hypothetical protein [Bifidobacterium sp. SO1]MBT1161688.1 hypothetical protein [Bifidobacterium sp. SO1]
MSLYWEIRSYSAATIPVDPPSMRDAGNVEVISDDDMMTVMKYGDEWAFQTNAGYLVMLLPRREGAYGLQSASDPHAPAFTQDRMFSHMESASILRVDMKTDGPSVFRLDDGPECDVTDADLPNVLTEAVIRIMGQAVEKDMLDETSRLLWRENADPHRMISYRSRFARFEDLRRRYRIASPDLDALYERYEKAVGLYDDENGRRAEWGSQRAGILLLILSVITGIQAVIDILQFAPGWDAFPWCGRIIVLLLLLIVGGILMVKGSHWLSLKDSRRSARSKRS